MGQEKKLSRRDFLKGGVAGIVGAAAAGVLGGSFPAFADAADAAGKYTPGTYSSIVKGAMGNVTVEVTFSADAISDIVIDASQETPELGGAAAGTLAQQVLNAQSADIDGVSGATMTSAAVRQAVENCIAQASGQPVVTAMETAEETSSWRIAPPAVEESEIAEVKTADIVIIGLGQSGLACARSAVENGASVIVIEKMDEESHSWTGCDFGHINSKWSKEQGIPEIDPVEVLNDWQLKGANMSNPNLVMQYLKNSGDTLDWFLEPGDPEGLKQVRSFHWPAPSKFNGEISGQKFWNSTLQFPGIFFEGDYTVTAHSKIVTEYAKSLGAKVFYATDAQYLEKDDSGRVTSVIAKQNGKLLRFVGTKAVVLAAGDFSRDAEMVRDLCPAVNALNFTGDGQLITGMDRDGQGIKMGVWAGGKIEPGPLSTMGGTFCFPSGLLGSCGNLWLDQDYKRFCNEGFGDPVLAGAEVSKHKGTVTSVFDADIYEQLQYFPAGHGSAFVNDPCYKAGLEKIMKEAYEAGADGVEGNLTVTGGTAHLFAADTLDELADYLGLDAEQKKTFLASVADYNTKCEAGYDDEYGKDPSVLFPVAKAPFYGFTKPITHGYEFLCTTGGLWTDNHQNVYDDTLEPIPGLYATGNCCGRRFGVQYSTPIAGVSVGMAQTMGRILGRYLATEV